MGRSFQEIIAAQCRKNCTSLPGGSLDFQAVAEFKWLSATVIELHEIMNEDLGAKVPVKDKRILK
jgi:hypothetical protein